MKKTDTEITLREALDKLKLAITKINQLKDGE